jgi:hypothetical protein
LLTLWVTAHIPHHAHIGSTGRDDALGFFAELETFHPTEKKPKVIGGDINVLMEANNVKRSRKVAGLAETVTLLPTWARKGWPKFVVASILSGVLFYVQLLGMHLLGLSSVYILLTTKAAKANKWWYTMHQKRLFALTCQISVICYYYHLGGPKMLFALTGAIWLSSNPPPLSIWHFSFYSGDHGEYCSLQPAHPPSHSSCSVCSFHQRGLKLQRVRARSLYRTIPPPCTS